MVKLPLASLKLVLIQCASAFINTVKDLAFFCSVHIKGTFFILSSSKSLLESGADKHARVGSH